MDGVEALRDAYYALGEVVCEAYGMSPHNNDEYQSDAADRIEGLVAKAEGHLSQAGTVFAVNVPLPGTLLDFGLPHRVHAAALEARAQIAPLIEQHGGEVPDDVPEKMLKANHMGFIIYVGGAGAHARGGRVLLLLGDELSRYSGGARNVWMGIAV